MAGYILTKSVKVSVCMTILVFIKTLSAQATDNITDNGGSEKSVQIVKRELRWNSNGYIVSDSSTSSNIKIDYLQPHNRNVEVQNKRDYMAFTLYMRNGNMEVPNTGVFHFIDTEVAKNNKQKCSRKTLHEGAYYHFYNKCPEKETKVVASGYCYRGSKRKGLVFNSRTFNSASMTYADGQFYLGTNRIVNSIEQSLIRSCFESWKKSGFKVTSWKCPTSGIPTASRLTGESGNSRFERSSGECNECECTSVNGSPGSSHWNYIGFALNVCTLVYLFSI